MSRRTLALRLAAAAALAAAPAVTAAPAAAQLPSSIFVFGDSYSDAGNGDILAASLGAPDQTPTPPYWRPAPGLPGTISNGPVWAQYLSGVGIPGGGPSLGGGQNFAFGTARTGEFGGFGPLPIGMLSQVDQLGAPVLPGDALYALFGGALDAGDAATAPGLTPLERDQRLQQAADNIGAIVTDLYGRGARDFLIFAVPQLGSAPATRATPAEALLNTFAERLNVLYMLEIASLRASLPDADFEWFATDDLFTRIQVDAAFGGSRYGITNTTLPCFGIPPYAPVYTPPPPGWPSCDASLFVDTLHPTTRVHEIIAGAVFSQVVQGVNVAAVPEPSTVALLAGGLVALAAGARRRARR